MSSLRDLAPTDRQITRLRLTILRLARRIRQNTASPMSPPQQSILAILDSYGPLSPGQLADIESVQPPSITRVLGQLEQAGLVTRTPTASNLRQVEVRLTDKGHAAASEVHHGRDEWLHDAMGQLDGTQLQQLSSLIAMLERLVDGEPSEGAK